MTDAVEGWSVSVGELKQALANVPDDYEVVLDNAEADDCEISAVTISRLYPPSPTGEPGLVILGGGQVITSEYEYHNRMDAHHAVGGDKYWDTASASWKGWT